MRLLSLVQNLGMGQCFLASVMEKRYSCEAGLKRVFIPFLRNDLTTGVTADAGVGIFWVGFCLRV